eukprot:TRINITY_DN3217_c0_g1_i10.p2 TRINITY_DN3217_c0_g1~~TRINITY_DN3217_c0_g1_i10.p2  ORF type:complete len:131 (-),score=31.99 TRINITY_DN3217_c0_g1_i10:798-1190(-)
MHAALDDFASGHFQHLFVAQGETDQSSCPSCGDEKQPEAVEAILDGFQLVSMVYLFNSLAGFRFQKRLLTEIVSAKVDPVLLEELVSLRFKDLSSPVPPSFIKWSILIMESFLTGRAVEFAHRRSLAGTT